ncbi:hypothetical protein COT62_00700 [Candidatus Roizmanbacteria bacterium CG09_land_8_20_14_0_10_41_9]|uniref:Uncharacterized protein n=1 Tax=Candidatus Roizmanbacteria bacterium CG09_land_8_20_14_0_10_41_9 TaxID=1974850 RepID=A0A2H0WVP9_9BACT|nr:MAG: hypothetical protein COT62_00700 [Candidatus Roizmanbacteria bacterium CG09_land_8_20_14_0_10_41_9]
MVSFLKKYWYVLVILAIAVGGFVYWRKSTQATLDKKSAYTVKKRNLKEMLTLSGEVDAEEKTTLRFQTSGKLAWVGVKVGDYVKKFQGIASQDQAELQKNLKKYLNTYVNERLDFEQSKDDNSDKGLKTTLELAEMQRLFEKAQYDLDNAVIDVELKDIALKYSYLYTPIEGIVVRAASPYAGVYITPTQAEFEIVNPTTIYFSITADQTEVWRLRQDELGEVILDSYPDETIKGKIYFISFVPKEDETGTVYQVKLGLTVDNSAYKYRIGMTGDVNFLIKEVENVLSVPTSMIKKENGKAYVLKLINGKPTKTYIKTAEEIDANTIVTSGLQKGDVIYD